MSRTLPGAARRSAAPVAAAAALLLAGAAAPAAAASSAPPATARPAGLYGTADPTYDGVFRQATALLALSAAGVTPPAGATAWLQGQQCADGGFTAYRADPGTPCDAKKEDTNSTGMAVQALTSYGSDRAVVDKAVAWMKNAQNADGGWGYQAGAGSDPDSTALVAGALRAAGTDPGALERGGHRPLHALSALQLGCGAKAAQRGAFAYLPAKNGTLAPNDKATTDGVLAARSQGYLVPRRAAGHPAAPAACPAGGTPTAAGVAAGGSAYLTAALAAHGHHLMAAQPGGGKPAPDPGGTAYAVIALASDGRLTAARQAYAWLVSNGGGWARTSPAGLGALVLAAHATGSDPHSFGGTDLVRALTALGPRVTGEPSASAAASPAAAASSGTSAGTVWWIVGAGLVAGIGAGIGLSLRGRRAKRA